jgi:cell wall-associated NlpC family hydrolase
MSDIDKPTTRTVLWLAAIGAALWLTGCASRVELPKNGNGLHVQVQHSGIAPGNGGALVSVEALQPGDILLSSIASMRSLSIRLGTLSPVSHAILYLGDGEIAEAVGSGVRTRTLAEVIAEEEMVVAFRVPGVNAEHAARLRKWSLSKVGTPYNTTGVLLSAPFVLNRRLCELPLVPSPIRDFCVSGLATIQLGASRNDRFFCSQFVIEAYNQAGLPITRADPRWVSPADLLHMREDDVPSIAATQPLRYIGHLKYGPPLAQAAAKAPV